jgi:hypothetical protein
MEPIEIGNRLWLDLNNDGTRPMRNTNCKCFGKSL